MAELQLAAPGGIDVVLAFAGGRGLERMLDLVPRGGRIVYPNGVEPEPEKRSGVRLISYDAEGGVEAFTRLTRASEVDSESTVVFRLLGRTHAAKGETDEAIEAYRAAIEVNEGDAWSMNNLALLLVEARRADEALPLLAKAVELRNDVAEFHNNLGMALEHTGRFKAAAKAYGEALTTDPAYSKAKKNLARVEAVKSGPEEPFDVEQAAKSVQPPTKDAGVISPTADHDQAATR